MEQPVSTSPLDRYPLGAIPSPYDGQDFVPQQSLAYRRQARAASIDKTLLSNVSLTAGIPPRESQVGPRCVAWEARGTKRYEEHAQLGVFPDYDAMLHYDRCQAIDGIPMPHDGTTIRASLYVQQHQGMHDKLTGHNYLIGPYFDLLAETDPVSAVALAIGAFKRPVAIGFDWYSSFWAPEDPDGKLPGGILSDPIPSTWIGGHDVWVYAVRTAQVDFLSSKPLGPGSGTNVVTRVAKGERLFRTVFAWGPTFGNGNGIVDIPEHLLLASEFARYSNSRGIAHDLWAIQDR